jgi:hypothetical protein
MRVWRKVAPRHFARTALRPMTLGGTIKLGYKILRSQFLLKISKVSKNDLFLWHYGKNWKSKLFLQYTATIVDKFW